MKSKGAAAPTGTALIHVPRDPMLFSSYLVFPGGAIRKPLDRQDWLFWKTMAQVLGWNRVGETFVGDMRISTVFLGLDHDFMLSHEMVCHGPTIDDLELVPPVGYRPLVFETMIFGGVCHLYQRRYRTLKQAKFGHKRAVLKARSAWAQLEDDHAHEPDDIPPL